MADLKKLAEEIVVSYTGLKHKNLKQFLKMNMVLNQQQVERL
jgi:hypothetical protein